MVCEATTPNVSPSAHVHNATVPFVLFCAFTHAALPPKVPALALFAPLNWLVKLVMNPLGEMPVRFPPMNRMICGGCVPETPVLFSYTADTTWLACPALLAITCCWSCLAFICFSSEGLRT